MEWTTGHAPAYNLLKELAARSNDTFHNDEILTEAIFLMTIPFLLYKGDYVSDSHGPGLLSLFHYKLDLTARQKNYLTHGASGTRSDRHKRSRQQSPTILQLSSTTPLRWSSIGRVR